MAVSLGGGLLFGREGDGGRRWEGVAVSGAAQCVGCRPMCGVEAGGRFRVIALLYDGVCCWDQSITANNQGPCMSGNSACCVNEVIRTCPPLLPPCTWGLARGPGGGANQLARASCQHERAEEEPLRYLR